MNAERKTSPGTEGRALRARRLAALGDPTRLGIMELLAVQDVSPDALAAALEIPGNLLAHHLKTLENVGLVRREHSKHDRRRTYVQAVDGALNGLLPQPLALVAQRVVFVCTHNSARSILAEALWRSTSDVPTASAGTSPAAHINPGARDAADRLGLSLVDKAPQMMNDVLLPGDVVVSVCDAVNEELAPMANERVHWSIPDPAALGTQAAFDSTVIELRHRIAHLAPRITYQPRPRTRRAHS